MGMTTSLRVLSDSASEGIKNVVARVAAMPGKMSQRPFLNELRRLGSALGR